MSARGRIDVSFFFFPMLPFPGDEEKRARTLHSVSVRLADQAKEPVDNAESHMFERKRNGKNKGCC